MDSRQAFFLYTALVKIVDTITVVGVWHLCWVLRFQLTLLPTPYGLPRYETYSKAAWPLAIVFLIALHLIGAYKPDRIHFGFRALKKIVHGSILGTLMFVALAYFQKNTEYSRVYFLLFVVTVILVITLNRILLDVFWTSVKKRFQKVRTLVVGDGPLLQLYVTRFTESQPHPVKWVGRLGENETSQLSQIPYLGTENDLSVAIAATRAKQVILAYPPNHTENYASLLEKLSKELVSVKLIPDYGRSSTFTYMASDELGIPLLLFNQPPVGTTDKFLKRVGDFLGAFFFLTLFSPVYLLIGLLVRFSSPGPSIYSQRRVGADGREFNCYKFRSMRVDAEKETGPVWANKNDARVTPIGKWLRRTSLDELPQFFNILKGEMSLVGPRPERPNFVEQFKEEIPKYMLRHQMKSGITGWAQINGYRGDTSLEKRIQYDLYYIGHWSHLFDIKILTMTPWVVIKGFFKGLAY